MIQEADAKEKRGEQENKRQGKMWTMGILHGDNLKTSSENFRNGSLRVFQQCCQ